MKALWGGHTAALLVFGRHTSEGGRQNIHAFQDRRMDKDRQSVLQEIWFDTKASDPPRSHGFAHEFSRREKTKKEGNFWLFKALKLKLCFLRGRGAIFLAEKWLAKSTKGAPDVPSEVNSGPQRERAQKTNNGPRLRQESFSCKIMNMHLFGLVRRL